MFAFFSRNTRSGIGKRTLKTINDEVVRFLEAREVIDFKVFTIDYENYPVVLIQAMPQKKLRFSNILEIQIKRHIREKLEFQIPAVFWRFKTDDSDEPGPEQVDYNFEETPEYPQDKHEDMPPTEPNASGVTGQQPSPEKSTHLIGEHYDIHHLSRKGMEVEEISMGEFDEFLRSNSADENS